GAPDAGSRVRVADLRPALALGLLVRLGPPTRPQLGPVARRRRQARTGQRHPPVKLGAAPCRGRYLERAAEAQRALVEIVQPAAAAADLDAGPVVADSQPQLRCCPDPDVNLGSARVPRRVG